MKCLLYRIEHWYYIKLKSKIAAKINHNLYLQLHHNTKAAAADIMPQQKNTKNKCQNSN